MSKGRLIRSFLLATVFVLTSCLSQGAPQQTTASALHSKLLKPAVAVPAACPITPVFTGDTGKSGLGLVPWMKAEPSSAGIIGYLFFADSQLAPAGLYRPLHTGGSYPDGSTTKILWVTDHHGASTSMQITGTKQGTVYAMFQQTFPMASPAGNYPSLVNIPTAGCWQLQLTSGTLTAAVTVWAVGNA